MTAFKLTAVGTVETTPGKPSSWSVDVDRAEALHIEPAPAERGCWVRVRFTTVRPGAHSASWDRDGLHVLPERLHETTQELVVDLSRVTLTISPADPR